MILAEKGDIVLQTDPASWVRTVLNQLAFHEARIDHEIALQSRALKLRHQDPADRFLAATAMVYQLTLVTASKTLFACRDISVLRNQTGAGHRNVPKA
jgi:PIN domain nuclease of toxin-antitoxin system